MSTDAGGSPKQTAGGERSQHGRAPRRGRKPLLDDGDRELLRTRVAICIQPASTQDRAGALDVIEAAHAKSVTLQKLWADGGYAGTCETRVGEATGCELEIVRRSDDAPRESWVPEGQEPPVATGFQVVKWRWIVERTFGWLGRYRRLSKDYEQAPTSSLAWVRLALVWMLTRRLGAT